MQLTPRQTRVVDLRLKRLGRREIAHALGVSVRTVKADLDQARAAIGACDEVELLIAADRARRGAA